MPDWANLEHAYGSAADLPELLGKLSPDLKAPVWHELFSKVCHQGSVYSASFHVLPYLAEAAAQWPPESRVMPLTLAAAIICSDDIRGFSYAPLEGQTETVEHLRRLALESLSTEALPHLNFIYFLKAARAFSGDVLWGSKLDGLSDGEFEGTCGSCGSVMHLLVGKYGFFTTCEDGVNRPGTKRCAIEPSEPSSLTEVGAWLYQRCIQAAQPELAKWIQHLFGSTICPNCGSTQQVSEVIAQAAAALRSRVRPDWRATVARFQEILKERGLNSKSSLKSRRTAVRRPDD
jgi:hypothetical protein